jgi:hypothetical protein
MSDNSGTNNSKPTFLHRWSQRKQQNSEKSGTRVSPSQIEAAPAAAEPVPNNNAVNEQELPSLESLDENSEVSMFFSDGVSETIKRQALRKLFHMDKFNVVDGLDDYAEDYTGFQPLGDVITAHQRLREEKEKLRQAMLDNNQEPAAASSQGETITEPDREDDGTTASNDQLASDSGDDEDSNKV